MPFFYYTRDARTLRKPQAEGFLLFLFLGRACTWSKGGRRTSAQHSLRQGSSSPTQLHGRQQASLLSLTSPLLCMSYTSCFVWRDYVMGKKWVGASSLPSDKWHSWGAWGQVTPGGMAVGGTHTPSHDNSHTDYDHCLPSEGLQRSFKHHFQFLGETRSDIFIPSLALRRVSKSMKASLPVSLRNWK